MRSLFSTAFVLGIAVCLPPGAVFAEAIRRGLAGGFRHALSLELGSLVGDATWAVAGLGGATFLARSQPLRAALTAGGCLLLLRLGLSGLRAARRPAVPSEVVLALPAGIPSLRADFAAGALISLANPSAIAFWLGIGGVIAASQVRGGAHHASAVFLAGFLLACLLYCPLVSAAIAFGRRVLRRGAVRILHGVSGCALTVFAVRLAWSAFA